MTLRPIIGPKDTESGVAQPQSFVEHRLKHRRQIARRGVDHLQYLGGRRLLFQCLALFRDQPCVLDRDHGLIREGADKCDLAVSEWLHALAHKQDDSDRLAVA